MINEGQVMLPRFQRHEAWKPNQIEGVFENILRLPSLPIGALLVLEVGDDELFLSRPISGAPQPTGKPQMNLLDGQQRMTALWRALTDDYKDEFTVFVSLENEEHPEIEICKRYFSKKGDRMPRWADNPADTFKRNLFPVSLLCPGSSGEKAMHNWIEKANVAISTNNAILKLRHRLASYQIPFLSLPTRTEKETALDVFIKMNTSATPLKDYDIVVAQLEGATGKSLHGMIKNLYEKVPDIREYGKAEDIALAVGALLNGKPALKLTYLDRDFGEDLENVWEKVVTGLSRGIECLREEKIFNEKLLPTEVIVYLASALWANVPEGVDEEGHARTQIRKAIWRASFTDRYFKTATTRAFADYKAIKNLIDNPGSTALPDLFDEKQNPLPKTEELLWAGWPGRKDRLGRAVIAVSLYNGGLDFADGAEATAKNVRSREYHHIYPRSLIENKFPGYQVNSALNCALISWKTNRKIAAKKPSQYIDERAEDAKATKEQVKQRLESHLVPYDELMKDDFNAFLEARANNIHSSMEKLCQGSRP